MGAVHIPYQERVWTLSHPHLSRAGLADELRSKGWKTRFADDGEGPIILVATPFEIRCPIHHDPSKDHTGCLDSIYDVYIQIMHSYGFTGTA